MDFVKQPCLLALTGSRLYGIATSTSDVDYISVTVPPKEYLYGLKTFEQTIVKKDNSENTVYSLLKFFKNLANGSINSLEALYSNETIANTIGEKLISQREIFLSKKFVKSILHYAQNELGRAKSTTQVVDSGERSKDELFETFINVFQLDRFQRATALELVNEVAPIVKTISTKHKVGDKRRSLIDKYGFDTKASANYVRLLSEAVELLTEGQLIFPRKEEKILRSIRGGELGIDYIEGMGKNLIQTINMLMPNSKLPEVAPVEAVNRLYMELIDG
jgi:hypothetical protein